MPGHYDDEVHGTDETNDESPGKPAYPTFTRELDEGTMGLKGTTEVQQRRERVTPENQNILETYLNRVEQVTERYGDVLRHTGGARTSERNAQVGGKGNSRHLWGRGDADDFILDPESERVRSGEVNIHEILEYAQRIGLGAMYHDVKTGAHLHLQYPKSGPLRQRQVAKADPE